MRIRRSATLVVAAAGLAGALCGAARPDGTSAGQVKSAWRVVYQVSSSAGVVLSGIAAPGRRDAWAIGHVGEAGIRAVYLLWNGSAWHRVDIPGAPLRFTPQYIQATSRSDIWIFGQLPSGANEALVWNGSRWQVLAEPAGADAEPAVLGRSDVWTTKGGGCTSPCTVLYHWTGSAWLTSQVPFDVYDLVPAGHDALALTFASGGKQTEGPPGRPVLYERSAGAWHRLPGPRARLTLAAVAARSASDIWLWGYLNAGHTRSALFHWTGSAWSRIAVPAAEFTQLPLLPDGGGGAWISPFTHWTGKRWVNLLRANARGIPGFAAMANLPGGRGVWLAGSTAKGRVEQGVIARYGPVRSG